VKELNKREKIIVSIFTVIFVAFLVNRFVLEPQNKKMKQLRKELASLSEQTASIGPKLVEFNRLKSDLIRKKKRLAAVEQALSQTGVAKEENFASSLSISEFAVGMNSWVIFSLGWSNNHSM
jgi:type II secretory pathway component PulM